MTTQAQDPHDQGLSADLARMQVQGLQRRQALAWLLGASGLSLIGCGGSDSSEAAASGGTTSGTVTGTTTGSCSQIPTETAGPYPGDGSNNANGSLANALALSGIVRSDIRASIAGASGVAGGVPLTLTLRLVNSNAGCAGLAGYAIYLWHCDREGRYSMYSSGVTAENYLRGVQVTGSDGLVTFSTIIPGCYDGRMPHMHFEVYRSASTAQSYATKLRTSQIAFPTDVCSNVYNNAPGYSASVSNLARISFATDNVFSDGVGLQTASLSGSVAQGYSGAMTVAISV
ncbi:dioxygenase family protein [Roseateles oligotrophus]|uniref:Intradiol ring-cleavage dioxygenase n=1 Tax=Roseateles oligotrophus TaxID=1769250 RepID=A0ABT2YKR5_9BURK|nr:intradiol ring-cleavage dioxygenase [Roseateles oligotrophus]MCV2370587.1 intradiol ring-cleavage dioxygenase [Roseateles oligotrophus]